MSPFLLLLYPDSFVPAKGLHARPRSLPHASAARFEVDRFHGVQDRKESIEVAVSHWHFDAYAHRFSGG
jgi:hypothetical protein